MKRVLLIASALILSLSLSAQVSGSYQKLTGSRLKQLFKTKGNSESGRNVSLFVPGSIFPAKSTTRTRWVRMQYKGLSMLIDARNPYWIQVSRKLRKSSKGKVLVKGRVRKRRERDGKFTHYLLVQTLQKTGLASSGKGKKRKKS